MVSDIKYKYSAYSLWFTSVAALLCCYFFTWHNHPNVNLIDGDARYYYYYLQSTFIDPALAHYDWLSPDNGIVITHHPVGLSLLLLPFFLAAYGIAFNFQYPLDGLSAPFQASISIAAVFYGIIGLIYLKKLLMLNRIPDKVTALMLPLILFGTNLYYYTITESAMSHVYSFCFITLFLYQGCKLVNERQNKNLLYTAITLGFILLLRPNNGLIVFSLFFWFRSKEDCISFFRGLVKNKALYTSALVLFLIILLQPLTWLLKENTLFVNRYAAYGFYWLHPHPFKMLFGFDAGFFIYTPLCFLFLFGLIALYKENKFLFYGVLLFLAALIYIFSAYCAYTYNDGIGIRVLVDYYGLFAFIGARLFMQLYDHKVLYNLVTLIALFFVFVNLVYCYQGSKNILSHAGMTYNKWKYIFLKTGSQYENCLGGNNDLAPYAKATPPAALSGQLDLAKPFDFSGKEYGVVLSFDSIGFSSKRVHLEVNIRRRERYTNSSSDALFCAMLENKQRQKKYLQFKMDETPSTNCCEDVEYHYTSNMDGDFRPSDHLSVYLWNLKRQDFLVDKFSVQIYNYN